MNTIKSLVYYKYYLLTLFIGLTACALSPQIINIKPDIAIDTKVANAKAISLEVRDKRSSPILGQRGGVYKDTSNISTSENMTNTLRGSLVSALQKQGYTIIDSGTPQATLTVQIDKMNYQATTEKLLNKVALSIEVSALVKKSGQDFTGEYRGNRTKEYVKVPSIEENERLINETLATVLQAMLSDNDLIQFMQ